MIVLGSSKLTYKELQLARSMLLLFHGKSENKVTCYLTVELCTSTFFFKFIIMPLVELITNSTIDRQASRVLQLQEKQLSFPPGRHVDVIIKDVVLAGNIFFALCTFHDLFALFDIILQKVLK